MKAMDFICHECGYEGPSPRCRCQQPKHVEWTCTECKVVPTGVELAPNIWICPGCVDMHRRRMGAAA